MSVRELRFRKVVFLVICVCTASLMLYNILTIQYSVVSVVGWLFLMGVYAACRQDFSYITATLIRNRSVTIQYLTRKYDL